MMLVWKHKRFTREKEVMAIRHFSLFTLLELLVIMAIIAVLVALLLPVLNKSKTYVFRADCANNLRQIGMAAIMYTADNDNYFLYEAVQHPSGLSWDTQWKSMIFFKRYLTGNDDLYHCSSATPENTGKNPAFINGGGDMCFQETIEGVVRYTDYKTNDDQEVCGKRVTVFRDPSWVVISMDIDWTAYDEPRHELGEQLVFLTGNVQWKKTSETRFMSGNSFDPYGNDRWHRWGTW